jgi:L-ascorbate metabolism protein UlaG (beta-lactamase superfamily)
MTAAQGEFEGMDVIAATHRHLDHFHAPLVAAHLSNNSHGKFVSCEQAVDILAAEKGFGEIRDRVLEITPDSLFYKDTLINDIGVRVYRLAHGPYLEEDPNTGKSVNRHRNIQNLGFLFTIEGVKVFHCGDSSPRCWDDYEHFRLDQEDIDIALLGRGFLASTNGFGMDIIRDHIQPDHIVLMHIHHDGNSYYKDIADQVKEEFPSVTIFESLMDTKEFRIQ